MKSKLVTLTVVVAVAALISVILQYRSAFHREFNVQFPNSKTDLKCFGADAAECFRLEVYRETRDQVEAGAIRCMSVTIKVADSGDNGENGKKEDEQSDDLKKDEAGKELDSGPDRLWSAVKLG